MTDRIPDDVLEQAWSLYLWKGESYNRISIKTRIPTTTVFNILQGQEKVHPDYPLMRALARGLRIRGMEPHEFAAGVRIHTLLKKYGIDPIDGENLIEKLLAECYKAKWTPSEAIANLRQFTQNAEAFGHSPAEHAAYVNKIIRILNDSKRDVEKNHQNLAELIHSKSVIEKNLQVFLTEGGMVLSDITERMASTGLREENENLRKELALHRSGQSVDKEELEKLNKRLIIPTTEQRVLDISNDVRLNPAKYSELFQNGIPRLATNFKPFQDVPANDHNEVSYEQENPTNSHQPFTEPSSAN